MTNTNEHHGQGKVGIEFAEHYGSNDRQQDLKSDVISKLGLLVPDVSRIAVPQGFLSMVRFLIIGKRF